jgi:hypothetical protein
MFDHPLVWDAGLFAGENGETEYAYQLTVADMASDWSHDRHYLPGGVEDMAPGVFLAAILGSVDPSLLSGHDLVRYVQAWERLVSHDHAGFYEGVAELAYATDPDTTVRGGLNEFASEELQAALAKTRRAADTDLDLALDLRTRIPQVWEALREGRIDVRRARIFARETVTLDPDLIPDVVEPLLEEAAELTTGQLGARIARRVIEADPSAAETEYQAGLEDRKMVVYPNPDHTGSIGLYSIDPVQAVAASNHVHGLALKLKRLPGETRTLDQLRADIALDLLQGKTTVTPNTTTTHPPKVIIQTSDGSPTGHITGYGPILISQLPKTADNITVEATPTTHQDTPPDFGTGECHETPSRRPTKTQVEHIQQTYPTCIYPGCRQPAYRCDIDHRLPHHKGGKTTCSNLAPLCRHHHRCKDQGGWQLKRNQDGSHTWTSPLRHTYTTRAPP